jgi:hypothetical protein
MQIDCATLGSLLVNPAQNGAPSDLYSYPPSNPSDDGYDELIPFIGKRVTIVGTINETLRTFQTHKETKASHNHLFFLVDYSGETIPVQYVWNAFQEGEDAKSSTTFFVDTCKYCSDLKNCMDGSHIHITGNLKSCGSKDHSTSKNKLKVVTSAVRLILPNEMKFVEWHKNRCTQKTQNGNKPLAVTNNLVSPSVPVESTKKEEGILGLFRGGKKLSVFDIVLLMPEKTAVEITAILKDLHTNQGAIYCEEDQIELPFAQIKWTK